MKVKIEVTNWKECHHCDGLGGKNRTRVEVVEAFKKDKNFAYVKETIRVALNNAAMGSCDAIGYEQPVYGTETTIVKYPRYKRKRGR